MNLLYIDPGTGSMLFTVLIGVLGTCIYLLRGAWVKLRFLLTGGKTEKSGGQDRIGCAIFAESKRYWNLFEPICDEFERREEKLLYLTASPDDPALQKSYSHVMCNFIGEGNRAFAHLNFLKADVLLATTPGLDVYQWKRSKDVKWYVHLPHASSDITLYRMFGLDAYDAVLLSGAYQIHQIQELDRLRGLPEKETRLVGMPYLDTLKRRLEEEAPSGTRETTVLLAPSWGESGILSRFGQEILRSLVATGYHLIIRPHPQSFTSEKDLIASLMSQFPESEKLEWNRDNDNFQALSRSHILISDFSGVIFDYALVFERPVIYTDTSFNKAPYDASWLEEELWTFTTLPKLGKRLSPEMFQDMKGLIDEMLCDSQYRNAIQAARDETWVNRGGSAAAVADYMLEKQKEL